MKREIQETALNEYRLNKNKINFLLEGGDGKVENSFEQQKEIVVNMGNEILAAIDKIQFILLHELIKMDSYERLIDECLDNGNHEALQKITKSDDYRKTFGLVTRANILVEEGHNAFKKLEDMPL